MAFDPTDANRIAAVNGNTVHLTVDGGRAWTSVTVPAAVACPPSYAAWQYFTSQGNRPACEAVWGGNRLYLALDGAVESYDPYDAAAGWTVLAKQMSTGRCHCPAEASSIRSFSASPTGRWAMVFFPVPISFTSNWGIEIGDGGSHHLTGGWSGRVWITPHGYSLWGGRTPITDNAAIVESYRPYTSIAGVTWTPVPTNASVDNAVRQFVAVGQGVLYGLQQRGPTKPPILQVSRDGGRTWTGRTLWAPDFEYDQLWAGGGAVALTACSVCGGPPTKTAHTDALYVSLDGGATWHTAVGLPTTFPVAVGSTPYILRVAFSGHRIWVAIGHAPYWYTGVLP